VVHDISERKRSEERLRQSQKLESIGLLAGGIAHDFNNILTAIMGAANLMEGEFPPLGAGYIGTIVDAAEKGANLTRQLLAYAGKGSFVIEELDFSAVVRDMASLIRLSLPKSIAVQFDLRDGLPVVSADPGQVQQVLMNLVINAGEAIGEEKGGVVSVATGTEEVAHVFTDDLGSEVGPGRYVSLTVADNGSGMDERTKARVFDPFFTTKFTGRGLGLAAVSGIVRFQKGSITIASAPGKGSTFRVLFPVRSVSEGWE
jgi:signal transduction histidine kinase